MEAVFISYSHTDSELVASISAILDELGIPYFLDKKDIQWGERISDTLRESLDNSSGIVIVVSPSSLKSQWVLYEVGYAHGKGKTLLPFLTHPGIDLPEYLRDTNAVASLEQVRAFFSRWRSQPVPRSDPPQRKRQLTVEQIAFVLEMSRPNSNGIASDFADRLTGREAASYRECVQLFHDCDWIAEHDNRYHLTSHGWKLADELWSQKILHSLERTIYRSVDELKQKVGLTRGEAEYTELLRYLEALKSAGFINFHQSGLDANVRLTQKGLNFRRKHLVVPATS